MRNFSLVRGNAAENPVASGHRSSRAPSACTASASRLIHRMVRIKHRCHRSTWPYARGFEGSPLAVITPIVLTDQVTEPFCAPCLFFAS